MEISSGAGYPASSLSNFAPHEFIIDGIKCASMEGFLQSLKFQNPDMKTITYNIAFTNISLNAKSDSNTACKNDYDTDVKSTKANIYNTVQKILKDSGFETNDTKAKINIYEGLINLAKTTRKLADNEELLSDLSNKDATDLKMTLNELIDLITHRRIQLAIAKNIDYWIKHTLKL